MAYLGPQLSVKEGPYICFFCLVDYQSLKAQTSVLQRVMMQPFRGIITRLP